MPRSSRTARTARCGACGCIASPTTTAGRARRAVLVPGCGLLEACGVAPEKLTSHELLKPGARFAVDAYVNFARTQPWPIAVSSSLTEMFAPDIMAERLEAFRKYYTWVPEWGFEYFQSRVTQARKDSDEALEITRDAMRHGRASAKGACGAAIQVRCAVEPARRHR